MEESLSQAFKEFLKACDAGSVEPIIGGSFASSAWSEPRSTNDIDVMIEADVDLPKLIQELRKEFVLPQEVLDEIKQQSGWPCMFQALHKESVYKVDVFLMDDSDFSKWEAESSRMLEFLPGLTAKFLSPEATALEKLRWYKLGNRASDRQWNDIVKLIESQGEDFNAVEFMTWAEKLELVPLAQEATAEASD